MRILRNILLRRAAAEGVLHNLVFTSKIMRGFRGMGQMMFTKYLVVVDDDVDVHNTSEVLFRLCARGRA